MFFKYVLEYLFLGVIGGSIYYFLEIIYRGYSHWSMFLLGGLCMMFFAFQGRADNFSSPLWKQVLRCTIFIASCEFITGMIVNKWFRMGIWDYSKQPLHIWGQICPLFTIFFAALSMLGIPLCGYILYAVFKEEKPEFHIRKHL